MNQCDVLLVAEGLYVETVCGAKLLLPDVHGIQTEARRDSQQSLHGLLLPVLLSKLLQGAVVPAQRREQHLLGLLLHTAVEQRL